MLRPEIRPPLFLALQNALAAGLSTLLLGSELLRRLLYAYPQHEILWQLSALSNATVMPVLRFAEQFLPTPGQLLAGLVAGIVIPLAAWWTRYWLATAVAGHLSLAALIIMTYYAFRRGNVAIAWSDIPQALVTNRLDPAAILFFLLGLFVLVMCLADHLAFFRFMRLLWQRHGRRKAA